MSRERIVVALSGGPEGDRLIHRAARNRDADLMGVHVSRRDARGVADPALLARQRVLIESLGGSYHEVADVDVPKSLLEFARGVNATRLVLGAGRRGRLAKGLTGGAIDIHVVAHERLPKESHFTRPRTALSLRRRLTGFALALLGLPLLTLTLDTFAGPNLISDVLLFLLAVVVVALVGGLWPAVLAAVGGFILLNYFFTPPVRTLTIAARENLLALLVFVTVGIAVSVVVDLAARRTREAAQAAAEAQTLATVAGGVLRGQRPLIALLQRLQETFRLKSVTLLEHTPGSGWAVAEHVGEPPLTTPAMGDAHVPVNGEFALVLLGHPLAAADRRILEAFAAQSALALKQERLAEEAATAKALAAADKMRTALLAAVSHDLRSPLSSAKAAITSLRGTEVEFDADDRAELLATAEESLDKLTRLVANLLDMGRLQAGVLGVSLRPVGFEEAVPHALDEIGQAAHQVRMRIPDDLPAVNADPGLLERVLVNLITNAIRFSPLDQPPTLTANEHDGRVELRVVDHGPGIPEANWDNVFLPFQRLGDRDNTSGVGLGLALSRGLAEAMGGTLTPQPTPGGGITMVLALDQAQGGES